ncbi:MAG: class I SAM-dependent methyltransferase [Steroidobacteraceae bacterium]|jgi:SAM-dependent methyltransferase|nr:class I SAM-dependent methyltransferase [Steroidobacteraceae bacterium]
MLDTTTDHAAGLPPSPSPAPRAIDTIALPTRDEAVRQRFVSTLRKRLMVDMAGRLRRTWDSEVEPQLRRRQGRTARDGREVRRAMLSHPYFKAWSALRYAAQEMTWWSVQPQVERRLPELVEAGRAAAAADGPGSLRLDPALPVPRDVSAMDIHLMPGCFHTEYQPDDVAVGAVYWHGTAVFSAGLKLRHAGGGVARSIAEYLRIVHPRFRPRRMLDIGCSAGNQLLPYLDVFPGCVGHGVDVGAPLLRFAHARSRALGYDVHYSQQDARRLDFADGSFDLVVSSFFLHEQSRATNRQVLKEARRLLAPGGIMVHMELPPAAAVDPYYNFYLDWDAYYNNEPHYAGFRELDPVEECVRAGFAREACFARRIPNFGTVPDEEFRESALGLRPAPAHGNGASWFIFGATR